jgi:hypothetical protein
VTRFAATTSVPVAKSKMKIEAILERYGAEQFMSGWNAQSAVIGFTIGIDGEQFRQIWFNLPMPDKSERRFTHSSKGMRSSELAHKEWEQACRQRWRALALVIKAKLEAVETGISTIEDEFLAQTVMDDGRTVSQHVKEPIALSYKGGVGNLLPDYSGGWK